MYSLTYIMLRIPLIPSITSVYDCMRLEASGLHHRVVGVDVVLRAHVLCCVHIQSCARV